MQVVGQHRAGVDLEGMPYSHGSKGGSEPVDMFDQRRCRRSARLTVKNQVAPGVWSRR